MKKLALISVSDKTGVDALARELHALGFTIVSTSGTARFLRDRGLEVIDVSDVTRFPEILQGRIKTLHPHIHAGILADRAKADHLETLAQMDISPIDLVAVNLYPFRETRCRSGARHQEIIENIDIGGLSLLRAAAKNCSGVIILCEPEDYVPVMDQLKETAGVNQEIRIRLALKAFQHVAAYDAEIADYFASLQESAPASVGFPAKLELSASLEAVLRYGENPHQQAALYSDGRQFLTLLHGLELSFNNHLDIDSTLRALRLFEEPTAVITKHCNPCGIGCAQNLKDAYQKAFEADTKSPFGGIVGLNRTLDLETAHRIDQVFTEIIIAPDWEDGVLDFLRRKKNRRLVRYDAGLLAQQIAGFEVKHLLQGWLLQSRDQVDEDPQTWGTVTQRKPSPREIKAMRFGWKVASLLRSNAIALTGEDRTLGLGAGQTSRIDSLHLAIQKAVTFGHDLSGAICASDGFFPFRDSIEALHACGIRAVVQPGGSKGDPEVIAACDELGLTMVFTGYRHFRH